MTRKFSVITKWLGFTACALYYIWLISAYIRKYIERDGVHVGNVYATVIQMILKYSVLLFLVFFTQRISSNLKTKLDYRWFALILFIINGIYLVFTQWAEIFTFLLPMTVIWLSALILFRGNIVVKSILFFPSAALSVFFISSAMLGSYFDIGKLQITVCGLLLLFVFSTTVLYVFDLFSGRKNSLPEAKMEE